MAFLELSLVVDRLFSVCCRWDSQFFKKDISNKNLKCYVYTNFLFLCSEEFAVRQCWSFVLATDTWKRGLLYLGLSAVCYIKAMSGWQVPFAGGLMDLASLVYFIKTIKGKQKPKPYRYKQLSVT